MTIVFRIPRHVATVFEMIRQIYQAMYAAIIASFWLLVKKGIKSFKLLLKRLIVFVGFIAQCTIESGMLKTDLIFCL